MSTVRLLVKSWVEAALKEMEVDGDLQYSLEESASQEIIIEAPKDPSHGDFATNYALMAAKKAKTNPRVLAEKLIAKLQDNEFITKIEIAGPGFINFFLSPNVFYGILTDINKLKENYGKSEIGKQQKVHLEFVSSNPTGPLHVGHGRHGAFGSCVANLLEHVGFKVFKEYYINDAGRQMQILALSLWLRCLELKDYKIYFPTKCYQGDYVKDIAQEALLESVLAVGLLNNAVEQYTALVQKISLNDDADNGDSYVDQSIAAAKKVLGELVFKKYLIFVCDNVLKDIREDLAEFGVEFDSWYSEAKMIETGAIPKTIDYLKSKNYLYEKDGALWFKTSEFGDEKDRVLIRSNGENTYFAPDIAYHLSKLERGYDTIVDILGSDHHGYIPRLRACLRAFNKPDDKFVTKLVQFVDLYRGEQKVPMSTRTGSFVTLRELRTEVGNDAARFFYVMRKVDQLIDFDIELAKSKSNENPVYYIQYAHARICSIFRQLAEKNYSFDKPVDLSSLNALTEVGEIEILKHLSTYKDIIEVSAQAYEPHRVVQYVKELAHLFHKYYNSCIILADDKLLRNARLYLILAVKQIIFNALTLLGISSPEKM